MNTQDIVEKCIQAYAHDYRGMAMSQDELATMLRSALTTAIEEARREALDGKGHAIEEAYKAGYIAGQHAN